MQDVERLKAAVKKAGGEPTPYQVDQMRYQQWTHLNDILSRPLEESYQARVIEHPSGPTGSIRPRPSASLTSGPTRD
jgi:hypothetical protein